MNRNFRRFLSELCVMTLLLSVLPAGAVAGAEEAAALMNEGGAKAEAFTAAKAVEIEDYDTPLGFEDMIDEAEAPAGEPAAEPAAAEEPAAPAAEAPAEEPVTEAPAEEPDEAPAEEPAAEAPAEEPVTEPAAAEEPAEPAAEDTPAPAEAAEEPAPEAGQEAEEPFDVEQAYHYYMSLGSDAEKDDFLLSLSESNRETLKRYIARMAAAAAAEAAARAALAAAQEAAPAEPAPEEAAEEPAPATDTTETPAEEPAPAPEAAAETPAEETTQPEVAEETTAEPDADTSAQQSVTIWYECLDGGEVGFGSQVCFHMNLEGVDPAEADYQWQISRDSGATWQNVDYATDSTYIITVSEDNAACLWRVLVNF